MAEAEEEIVSFISNQIYYTSLQRAPIKRQGFHYFIIDDELLYWNFYRDFGPLNLGQTFRFADILNKKIELASKTGDQIVFYSSTKGPQKANAVCILCCWGVLFNEMTAEEAFEPFTDMHFLPFHDATPGKCTFNLTILDCLKGLEKAIHHKFISARTFNREEFLYFERVENGDLTWISSKFIAFAGPHYQFSKSPEGYITLPPDHYIPYFKKKNVTLVVRLNDKQYDEDKFLQAGINHISLTFPDGSNAPKEILAKFIEECEKTPGAVAVHCKAGLGRTGTCIGAYLMKHHFFTAAEVIGWLRLCRPGSVIGPQQHYMEELEPLMWEAGMASMAESNKLAKSNSILKNKPLSSLNVQPITPIVSICESEKTQGDELNNLKQGRNSKQPIDLNNYDYIVELAAFKI